MVNAVARWPWLIVLIVASVLLAASLVASTRQASEDWWRHFSIRGSEVEQYGDLETMVRSSDAVVIGTITRVAKGRVFGARNDTSTAYETQVQYAAVTVSVRDLPAGDLSASDRQELTLELIAGTPSFDLSVLQLPAEDTIFFLRNKGQEARRLGLSVAAITEEEHFYRLVIGSAALRIFNDRVAPVFPTDDSFLMALDGSPFASVRRRITEADADAATP
jgi:hypothetical protein